MSDKAGPQTRAPIVSMSEVLLRADPGRQVQDVLPTALEFAPRDAIEARLCGLLVALSEAATFELALGGRLDSPKGRAGALGLADRLAGRAIQAAEAMGHYRRPVKQRIVVERMVVADGDELCHGCYAAEAPWRARQAGPAEFTIRREPQP